MPNMLFGTLLMLLLAASLGEAVPPAYRSRVEEKANTPAASSAPPVYVSPAPGSYTIPIRKVGNALLVDVLLNDTLTVTMPIDTGASSTCIAPSVARRLHLNPQQADILPVQTANGIILVPTTEVSSVSVGGATVRGVEVIVQNTGGACLACRFWSIFTSVSTCPQATWFSRRSRRPQETSRHQTTQKTGGASASVFIVRFSAISMSFYERKRFPRHAVVSSRDNDRSFSTS